MKKIEQSARQAHYIGKTSEKSTESLSILENRSREDLIEEWLALNPKDITDFDNTGIKKITTKVTITFDFGKEERLLTFQPLK
ncbi:MAG: hypothetical protein KGH76_03640 [Thaumarchaeota archaeon]|nr:hypothetical protein [Nitrososphaerota archaeon]